MPLNGRKILVVEDEYMIADDLVALLRQAGAEVIGPAASLPAAVRALEAIGQIDAAVLDINLRGINVFPVADELIQQGVPIMFLTGYCENNIPSEYADIARCEKPMGTSRVVEDLRAMIDKQSAAASPALS